MMTNKKKIFMEVFRHTIPVLIGYVFLGFAFGVLMSTAGYSFIWAVVMSTVVYAGSMQFITVQLLATAFNPVYALVMTIIINARHLFYGVSMLQKYQGTGKIKPYLIFGLTDETFSLLCSTEPAEGIDRNSFMLGVTLLNQIYWITGSAIGGIFGSVIDFNTKGIDFVMTALFVVIFVNQWRSLKKHTAALTGLLCSLLSLLIFGKVHFIIPAMIMIIGLCTLFQKKMFDEVQS